MKNAFKDGAKWQKSQEKSALSIELEEAAEEEYPCNRTYMSDDMLKLNAYRQAAFKAGAMWDREQGVSMEGVASRKFDHQYHGFPSILVCDVSAMVNQLIPQDTEAKVIIQIRKKDE